MRFPYQTDPAEDLRALFQSDRLSAPSRGLGQSSIDKGTGSLDVLDSDGRGEGIGSGETGGVVASIGDLPGGSQGIGVFWNDSITNVVNIFTGHEGRIGALEETSSGSNQKGWNTRQDRDIGKLYTKATNGDVADAAQDQRLAKVESDLERNTRRTGGATSAVADLRKRMQGQEDKAAFTEQESADLRKQLGAQVEQVRRAQSDIKTLKPRTDNLEDLVEEVEQRRARGQVQIDTQESSIFDIFTELGEAWANLGAADTRIGAVETVNGEQQVRLSQVEYTNGQQDERMDGHNTRLSEGEAKDVSQDGRMDGHASRLGAVEGENATQDSRLTATEGVANSARQDIDNAKGNASSINSRMGSIENKNDAQDGRLDGHASRLGAVEGENSTQGGRLNDHAERLGATEGVANGVRAEVTSARGSASSLNSRLGSADIKDDAQDGRLDGHASRLGAAEGDIAEQQAFALDLRDAILAIGGFLPDIVQAIRNNGGTIPNPPGGITP